MKCDSGLGITSPQSEESFTNMFPHKEIKNVVNNYSTINYPAVARNSPSSVKIWNSLGVCTETSPQKVKSKCNSIIELTLDQNNDMTTSIVIYRNDNRELRHINIIDYRKNNVSKVRRSNTFTNTRTPVPVNVQRDKKLVNPVAKFTVSRVNESIDDLRINSTISDTTMDATSNQISNGSSGQKKSSTDILRNFVSRVCCRKHLSASESESEFDDGDDDMETTKKDPEWRFSYSEFEDQTFLDAGSQGLIYTAILQDKKVVLKKIKDTSKGDEIDIKNLLALEHKNVITFIGVCGESQSCIVMEYCSKGQLFEWLRRDLEISPGGVCSWAHQICDGMAYLHSKDIIHRDLKSPNILIAEDMVLKIIDFEFSKECSESQILNSFVGTIAWMAPEVLREENHSKKVDVWSYGVVLWEMLTRNVPYGDMDRMAILYGVAKKDLSLPLCSSIPQDLRALLGKCWEPISEERPTFQEILENFGDHFKNLEHFSQEQFTTMQLEWKNEIETRFEEMKKKKKSVTETELIWLRNKELSDAKRIKDMYDKKLKRVDKLIDQLTKCLDAVDEERKRNENEWKLLQSIKQPILINSSNKDNLDNFFSLQFKNVRVPPDRSQKSVTPSHYVVRERVHKLHSMQEPVKTSEKINAIRRKHSAHVVRETNGVPNSKSKNDIDLNNKGKKKTKPTLKNVEDAMRVRQQSNSMKTENSTKKSENKWKRNSSPCRNASFSIKQSPNKTVLNTNDISGTINPSFQGSTESFGNNPDLQNTNSNFLSMASGIHNFSVNIVENPDFDLYPSYRRSLIGESIKECHHNEECQSNIEEINEDCPESHLDDINPVLLREISGRTKPVNTINSLIQPDLLNTSSVNLQSHNRLFEKEFATQNLIKQHNFLGRVNGKSSSHHDTEYRSNETTYNTQLSGNFESESGKKDKS